MRRGMNWIVGLGITGRGLVTRMVFAELQDVNRALNVVGMGTGIVRARKGNHADQREQGQQRGERPTFTEEVL